MLAGLDEVEADPAEEYDSAGDGAQSAGECEGEMWAVYGEEGYLSLICALPSGGAVGCLTDSEEDGGERAGLLWPGVIFCREEERDGGLGLTDGGVEAEGGTGES